LYYEGANNAFVQKRASVVYNRDIDKGMWA